MIASRFLMNSSLPRRSWLKPAGFRSTSMICKSSIAVFMLLSFAASSSSSAPSVTVLGSPFGPNSSISTSFHSDFASS